jgi:hypothetical protein
MRVGTGPLDAETSGTNSPVGSFGPLEDTDIGADPVSH